MKVSIPLRSSSTLSAGPLPIFNNQVFRIKHATLSETEDGVGKVLPIHVIGTIPLRTNDGGGLVLIIVIIATSTEAESLNTAMSSIPHNLNVFIVVLE